MKSRKIVLHFIEEKSWLEPRGKVKTLIAIGIFLVMIFSTRLVFITGGIKYVYAHIMYIPILLAAYFFQMPGGVIAGLIGGLALGPWMPIDINTGEYQETVNWIIRLGIFTIVGGTAGLMNKLILNQVSQFRWLSTHDADSGLPNRNHMIQFLNQRIMESRRDNSFAILTLLLSNHASITNLIGVEGISLLTEQVSKRVERQFQYASLHQLFPYILCVVLPLEKNEDELQNVLNMMLELLQKPFYIKEISIYVDLNIGAAIYPIHAENSVVLLRKAQIAAHIANEKDESFWIYQADADKHMQECQILLGDIQDAMHENQLHLHYQPIIDLRDGTIYGIEALLRWNHPQRGDIPPLDFLPFLERTALIKKLNSWVISNSIADFNTLSEKGFAGRVAINISARTLMNNQWMDNLDEDFYQKNIHPDKVVFEITESMLIGDTDIALKQLEYIKRLGCMLALDDFGTGYSSLEYIRRLPIDYLKVDRRFTRNLLSSAADQEIMKAAVALSDAMGKDLVIEGVETEEVCSWLKDAGCEFAQGYYFCRPKALDEISDYMGLS
ncbi:MAG: EAL domain-containing protein [Anaerolineales bacterium]|nr:EAL domain-containing protein [Anaerolineales bacterium]